MAELYGNIFSNIFSNVFGINSLGINLAGRDIIVIAGQSNANGFAFANTVMIADGYTLPFSGTYLFERLADTAGDPLVWTRVRGPVPTQPRVGDSQGDFGLESSMARYLHHARPNQYVIVKMAIPGASLAVNWKPIGSTYPTALPHLIDQFIIQLQAWVSQTGGTLRAIVWQQGENDCTNAAFAAAYQANLENLIDTVRVAFPAIPWIINRLHTGAGGSDNATVRAAQAAVVGTRTGVTLVDLDPLNITTLHFTGNQYVQAGNLDAVAVLNALSVNSPPFTDFRWFGAGTTVQFTDLTIPGGSATLSSWLWDFGDTGTSTSQNPSHVYAAHGTYTVKLTSTNSAGLSEQITKSVIVANNAWAIDGTSNKAVPNTGTELSAFFAACGKTVTGTALWRLQEASGVAADSIGTVTLTPNNGPTYAQAVAGWSRVGIKFTDGTSNQRLLNSTTAPNPALTPCLFMAYVSLAATPAAIRDIMGLVGNVDVRHITTGRLRLISGATGDLVNSASSTVQPIIIRTTPTGTIAVYTEQERFYGTPAVPTSATQVFFGGQTAAASAATYMWACELSGNDALMSDDDIRLILRTAGWNPAW